MTTEILTNSKYLSILERTVLIDSHYGALRINEAQEKALLVLPKNTNISLKHDEYRNLLDFEVLDC